MFEWIFYPWMISNAYTLLIIYARVYLTPIYSMLVLFTCCWGSHSSIQAEVGKLNRDLLQPSGIRYQVWSFSVRYLISIAYWKGLISRVKLFVVVPQAIWIFLRNNYDLQRLENPSEEPDFIIPFYHLSFLVTFSLHRSGFVCDSSFKP